MKTFTEDEKIIARNINKKYKWIARDHGGGLCVYKKKPKKIGVAWMATSSDDYNYFFSFNQIFSSIKYEDNEPTLISDIYNPQILTDAEKEYLRVILKPFCDGVDYIEKIIDKKYLLIQLYDGGLELRVFDLEGTYSYSKMEPNKKYTLDELGITYEE